MVQPIYRKDGKGVGFVDGDKYVSERDTTKHFYIKEQGYAIDDDVLSQLERLGVVWIYIIEHGKQIRTFCVLLNTYLGRPSFQNGKEGVQRCVPVSQMQLIKEVPK